MKRLYLIVLIAVTVLFVGSSPPRAESEPKPEINVADHFKVSWSSCRRLCYFPLRWRAWTPTSFWGYAENS